MQDNRHLLIIGAGQAGVQLASTLRESGDQRPITLLSAESHLPYQRPPLSKAFLHGDTALDDLAFRSDAYYGDHGIDLRLGRRVARLTRTGESGQGVATIETGEEIAFDRLVLAVGSRARRLEAPGAELEGILRLRDADDASALKSALEAARDVVIIGGGFIGLEVAASARKMGRHVTVVLPGERVLSRAVGEYTASFVAERHAKEGVSLRTGVAVARFAGEDGHVRSVHFADGTTLPADLVVVGIGAEPRVELATDFGLEVDCGGIAVDEHAVASDGVTLAVGDCAALPDPLTTTLTRDRVRLESVSNALEHARVAVATLRCEHDVYSAVPWFWSDQFDLKLQSAGNLTGSEREVVRGERKEGRFSVLYYAADRLIAIEAINRPAEFMVLKTAMTRGESVPAELAADDSVPIKTVIAQAKLPVPQLY